MANDSQRGYVSGILQRGARAIGLENPAAHLPPVVPPPTPVPSPDITFNDPHPTTVETPRESSSQTILNAAEQHLEQSRQPPDPPINPEDSITDADQRLPESPAIDARSPDLSRRESRLVDPSQQSSERLVPGAGDEPLPIRLETQSAVEIGSWGRKNPRLISVERADKTVVANAVETNAGFDIGDGPLTSSNALLEATSNSSVIRPQAAAALKNSDQRQMTPLRETGPVKDESILSTQSRSGGTIAKAEDLKPQESEALRRSPLAEPTKSAPARLAEGPTSASLNSESIEPDLKFVVAHSQAEPREESLYWHTPSRARAEERFTSGPGSQQQHPREETLKLTINRLDVQILNQPVALVVQAPARAPQPDTREELDRYHLGHLSAIF